MYLGIKSAHLCLCLTNLRYREIRDSCGSRALVREAHGNDGI